VALGVAVVLALFVAAPVGYAVWPFMVGTIKLARVLRRLAGRCSRSCPERDRESRSRVVRRIRGAIPAAAALRRRSGVVVRLVCKSVAATTEVGVPVTNVSPAAA